MGSEGDSDSPEEEEVTEQIVVDEERSPSSKTMDNNADDLEIGNEGQSSMDVVDETMVIDLSQSEDEPLKLPDDSSGAAATAASSTSPPADDDLASNDELLLDSRSDGAQSVSAITTSAPSSPSKHSGVRAEIVRTTVGDAPPLAFDLERTTNAWSAYLERKSTSQPAQPAARSSDLESADLGADDENATAALARVLSKADFSLMDVVGQFNRGFIVARLCKTSGEGATDDLFIVDQHAADEKYNFETLQETTRLESQKLFT
jgi:DNA mismatch repair protein PMS2